MPNVQSLSPSHPGRYTGQKSQSRPILGLTLDGFGNADEVSKVVDTDPPCDQGYTRAQHRWCYRKASPSSQFRRRALVETTWSPAGTMLGCRGAAVSQKGCFLRTRPQRATCNLNRAALS